MSTSVATFIGIFVALVGSGGILFTALRYNRTEAAGYIKIMTDLNESMEKTLERTKKERDDLIVRVGKLAETNDRLVESAHNLQLQVNRLEIECDRLTYTLAEYNDRNEEQNQ